MIETVKQMIDKLSEFDESTPVAICNLENDGFDGIQYMPEIKSIEKNTITNGKECVLICFEGE